MEQKINSEMRESGSAAERLIIVIIMGLDSAVVIVTAAKDRWENYEWGMENLIHPIC